VKKILYLGSFFGVAMTCAVSRKFGLPTGYGSFFIEWNMDEESAKMYDVRSRKKVTIN